MKRVEHPDLAPGLIIKFSLLLSMILALGLSFITLNMVICIFPSPDLLYDFNHGDRLLYVSLTRTSHLREGIPNSENASLDQAVSLQSCNIFFN